ncbi:response regulator transcription factor [Streptomyces sp. NPDC005892]|uniref:response regulator transcription factor n=1 Tax=Streptomyces sp. NPDC005892 TaxID=3155593 RepID=UPI0033CAE84C
MSARTTARTPPRAVRVLVCDDHAVVRAGLLALLGSEPDLDVVAEAGSGEEAVVLAARLTPDVVLMDLQLGPGIDGVEATRRITTGPDRGGSGTGGNGPGENGGAAGRERTAERGTGPHVLVLTTYDTDADITRAIGAGATGYLLKAERPEELFAAIRAAAQGRTTLSPPVADRVMARLRTPPPALTDRERDILGQLARGLGNRDIARALFISEATVKTHLGRIYDKLGVETRAGAVARANEQRLLP